MGVRLYLGRLAVAALLGAAGLVAVAAPAGATAAGPAGCVTYQATSTSGGWVAAEKSAQRGACIKPGDGRTLVMPGRTTAGVTSSIVCTYAPAGPYLQSNNVVAFTMLITCQGGTPHQLFAYMDMARYISAGVYVIEGVRDDCLSNEFPGLWCASQTKCFQAGATYDGYAHLIGVDEFYDVHEADYYAPPRYIGCII